MNVFALFMWVAMAGTAPAPIYGWVYQTDFSSKDKCVAAARDLITASPVRGGDSTPYRCVAK